MNKSHTEPRRIKNPCLSVFIRGSLLSILIILSACGVARADKRACCAAHQGICGCYCCDGVPLPELCDESERNACLWTQDPYFDNTWLFSGNITEQDTLPRDAVDIIIDGNILYSQGVLMGDRTMVPLRGIVELLGARTDYVDFTYEILIRIKGETIGLQVGSPLVYTRNGSSYLDVPPMLIGDRVFVPVRFISEYFGATVIRDNPTRTVKIIY